MSASQIGKKHKEILRILARPQHRQLSQSDLGNLVGVSQQRTQKLIQDLEEKNLVDIDKSPKLINIKTPTRQGFEVATCGQNVVSLKGEQEKEELEIRAHNIWIKFKIQNATQLSDSWVERYMLSKPVRHQYNPSNDGYDVFAEDFNYRITNRHVFVHVKEVRGVDPNRVKHECFAEAFRARKWLEKNSPVELTNRPIDSKIQLNQQHIAIMKDPLAQLVKSSSLDMQEIKICDKDGDVVLVIDESTGCPELESEHELKAESVVDDVINHYEFLASGGHEKLKDVADRFDALEQKVEALNDAPHKTELGQELSFSNKWIDKHGNLMGYSKELEKPVKIIDKQYL